MKAWVVLLFLLFVILVAGVFSYTIIQKKKSQISAPVESPGVPSPVDKVSAPGGAVLSIPKGTKFQPCAVSGRGGAASQQPGYPYTECACGITVKNSEVGDFLWVLRPTSLDPDTLGCFTKNCQVIGGFPFSTGNTPGCYSPLSTNAPADLQVYPSITVQNVCHATGGVWLGNRCWGKPSTQAFN